MKFEKQNRDYICLEHKIVFKGQEQCGYDYAANIFVDDFSHAMVEKKHYSYDFVANIFVDDFSHSFFY